MDSTSVAPAAELPPEDKWCTTCNWCGTNASRNRDTYKCFAPQNSYTISVVDGSRVYYIPLCVIQRYGSKDKGCTEAGLWWEQKPAAPDRQLASMGDEFELPPVDKTLLAAKLAAARKPKVKVGTDLLKDLGI